MSYQSLGRVDYTQNNTSKASEGTTRTAFNNKFQKIIKDNAQGTAGNIGLTYSYYNHKSTIVYGTRATKGYNTAQYPISGVYWDNTTGTYKDGGLQKDFIITAKTPTLAELKDKNPETTGDLYLGTRSIDNINLGLYVREQPDLAIIEDVDNIKLEVNGYEHTYNYNQRPIDINFMNGEITTGTNTYFPNKYSPESRSYTRELYKSDIAYSMDESTEAEDKLKVYITYKITIRNEAEFLDAKINELYSYYDARYELQSVTNKDGNTISHNNNKNNKDTYGQLNITDISIGHGNVYQVFIKYRLTDTAIESILKGDITVNTVTEIASYSSTRGGATYGGIDKDSAPNNYNYTSTEHKYEDDTDKAPPIVLTASKNREIKGSVWEDAAMEDLLNAERKQREGNGKYDANENVVGNVKVELIEFWKDSATGVNVEDVAKLYPFNNGSYSPSDATDHTNNNGTYEFEGVIPGTYYLRYTYGEESVIYTMDGEKLSDVKIEEYKSTMYKGGDQQASSMYWYKDTDERLSDARDMEGYYIDEASGEEYFSNIVSDRIDEVEEIKYSTAMDETKLKNIIAMTEDFNIKIDTNQQEGENINQDLYSGVSEGIKPNQHIFNNVDFGIIERPKQNLIIKKEISNIEVVLANGQKIINGDPRTEDISNLKMLPDAGRIHIEIDNEIIQGATLNIDYEIIVDNRNCEIDYNDDDYYYYYEIPFNKDSYKIATINQLYDYPSNGLNFNGENQDQWEEVEISEKLVSDGFISQATYDTAKTYKKVLMTEEFKNMKLGETKSVTIRLSRLLSNDEEDFDFVNDTEVITLKNRKIADSIPGNYVPGTSEHENDSDSATLIITGPTGENMNYAYYVGIGVLSLIIIGTGIILIKKKVLKKEK